MAATRPPGHQSWFQSRGPRCQPLPDGASGGRKRERGGPSPAALRAASSPRASAGRGDMAATRPPGHQSWFQDASIWPTGRERGEGGSGAAPHLPRFARRPLPARARGEEIWPLRGHQDTSLGFKMPASGRLGERGAKEGAGRPLTCRASRGVLSPRERGARRPSCRRALPVHPLPARARGEEIWPLRGRQDTSLGFSRAGQDASLCPTGRVGREGGSGAAPHLPRFARRPLPARARGEEIWPLRGHQDTSLGFKIPASGRLGERGAKEEAGRPLTCRASRGVLSPRERGARRYGRYAAARTPVLVSVARAKMPASGRLGERGAKEGAGRPLTCRASRGVLSPRERGARRPSCRRALPVHPLPARARGEEIWPLRGRQDTSLGFSRAGQDASLCPTGRVGREGGSGAAPHLPRFARRPLPARARGEEIWPLRGHQKADPDFSRWLLNTLKGFPSSVPIRRVGEGGLCPASPERGRVWEPSQGSHQDRDAASILWYSQVVP